MKDEHVKVAGWITVTIILLGFVCPWLFSAFNNFSVILCFVLMALWGYGSFIFWGKRIAAKRTKRERT